MYVDEGASLIVNSVKFINNTAVTRGGAIYSEGNVAVNKAIFDGDILDEWTVFSIGGGALSEGNGDQDELGAKDVYDLNKLGDIQNWCYENGRSYWEYVEKCEGPEIWDFLANIWKTMKEAIERGLEHEGVLPGPLKLPRKAANYYTKANGYRASLQSRGLVYAYALAVSEENASGGIIVTAPTCGACGVLP